MNLGIDGTNFKPIPFLEIEILKGVYTPTPHFQYYPLYAYSSKKVYIQIR